MVLTEYGERGDAGATWSCRTRDIGCGGIGLISRRMVHEDRRVSIRINGGAGQPARVLCGVVRHSCYRQGTGYIVGVEFAPCPPMVA